MEIQSLIQSLQTPSPDAPVTFLSADRAGAGRRRLLEELETGMKNARVTLLDLDFDQGGPWAGFRDFFEEHIETLQRDYPELVNRHAAELAYLLPKHKKSLGVRNQTLTDLAPAEEKVRNYPADRAYRVVHGLIELIEAYKTVTEPDRIWVWLCDGFDQGSHIGQRLVCEMARRRASKIHLNLVLAVEPAALEASMEGFSSYRVIEKSVDSADQPEIDREAVAARLQELEERVGEDKDQIEIHIVEMLRLSRLLGDREKIFSCQCRALDTYNSQVLYEDALRYGNEAWQKYNEYRMEYPDLQWALLVKLFMSNVGLQRGSVAWDLVEESKILEREDIDKSRRAQLYYLLAMLQVRYFNPRNLEKGEHYLEAGLADLEAARPDMNPEDYHFYVVFNRNGLALVRHFQGRFQEAIDLCREGYSGLTEHLSGDKHLLHRSVLLYNIGQVYSAMGEKEQAVHYYSDALAMDPRYSEYYNDRGSLYLGMGRLEEAQADYERAIELSPPYQEVWANLGQCFRFANRFEQATQCYSRALDLEPSSLLALIGRAQSQDALGHLDVALADYNAALNIDPDQWDALASRAVVHFQLDDPQAALADLDRAIELAPEQADLYHNRSVAREELNHREDAANDLRTYLELAPEAEDRTEVETKLEALTRAA